MDISVYIAMHKPYRTPDDSCYVPLQVGAVFQEPFTQVCDHTGDNISSKNPSFCELTALYWIWKNADADVAGLVHYRRHFAGKARGKDPWQKILSAEEIESLLKEADLLLPRKRHYVIETNYSQYAHAHKEQDLLLTRQVLLEQAPEYVDAFDTVMKRRSGHRFNMMIAKRDVLDRYCQWLFPLLFTLESRIDLSGYDAYNRRVIGFLSERLLDVWLEKEPVIYRELPVLHMEGENWLRKGVCFCLRKIGRFRQIR